MFYSRNITGRIIITYGREPFSVTKITTRLMIPTIERKAESLFSFMKVHFFPILCYCSIFSLPPCKNVVLIVLPPT